MRQPSRSGGNAFFEHFPVFSLADAERELRPEGGRAALVNRFKHHLRTGRLKVAARGVYAVVPFGLDSKGFEPDPFLVAAALRPDAVFAFHSALQLLGTAHTTWHEVTAFSRAKRAGPMTLVTTWIRFLPHPRPLLRQGKENLGVVESRRGNRQLLFTGRERTLIDGFRQPRWVGGFEELEESAAGFASLDFELLRTVLEAYGSRRLFAATGWFLERYQQTFYVADEYLKALEQQRPRAPLYLDPERTPGRLFKRWNLIVPEGLLAREPDEP